MNRTSTNAWQHRIYGPWAISTGLVAALVVVMAWERLTVPGVPLFFVAGGNALAAGYISRTTPVRRPGFLLTVLPMITLVCVIEILRLPDLTEIGKAIFAIFAAVAFVALLRTVAYLRGRASQNIGP